MGVFKAYCGCCPTHRESATAGRGLAVRVELTCSVPVQGGMTFMSPISRMLFQVLKVIRFKDRINFIAPKRATRRRVSVFPARRYRTTSFNVLGRLVQSIIPVQKQSPLHVIFFHGGGYSIEASSGHFRFIREVMGRANCTVSYIDYPLAPESTAAGTFDMAIASYKELLSLYPEDRLVFMGDSAGGGLALSLAMLVRDSGLRAPRKIVLFSPWLDIGLLNEGVPRYEKRDFILNARSLRAIGKTYSGDLPETNYLVSPKYGDVSGLGDIAVFFGSEEIFRPDCVDFCAAHNSGKPEVRAYEYEGMQHDWVLLPIPEAYHALDRAVAFAGQV
jgi:monoterpene epsilon-lactone hydrolase